MTASLFIRTCKKDIEWIPWCLRSIRKFVRGFDELVICIPYDETDSAVPFLSWPGLPPATLRTVNRYPHDHDGQQFDKMEAWKHCRGDVIYFLDSDCLFLRPFTPQSMITPEGKLWGFKTPYEFLGNEAKWKAPTEEVLEMPVKCEYMRRWPYAYHRATLQMLQEWFEKKHGSLRDWILVRKRILNEGIPDSRFSEFNVIGAWAELYDSGRYYFQPIKNGEGPPDFVKNFWSWGGTIAVQQQLEKIVS